MNPSIDKCITALRQGQPILCLIRDDSGATRGSLILAAENATPAGVNLLALEGRGVVCAGIDATTAQQLDLTPMVPVSDFPERQTHSVSTISIDAREGITTGISAGDRAVTLQLLTSPTAGPDDFVRPGHLFPYVAHSNGVLGRPEAPEAAVDLMRMAKMKPAAAFCGVLDKDGSVADAAYLEELAERTGLPTVTMDELVEHRLLHAVYLTHEGTEAIETGHGLFQMESWVDSIHDDTHHVLKANVPVGEVATVYVHRACVRGDVFGAKACNCRTQLDAALKREQDEGGMVIYLGSKTPYQRALSVAAQLIAYGRVASVRLLGEHALASKLEALGIRAVATEQGYAPCGVHEEREAMHSHL